MRNKFIDWIKDGVARFDYKNIEDDMPRSGANICPIVRMYNTYWGQFSDTHMSNIGPDKWIITGSLLSRPKAWGKFTDSLRCGGIVWAEATPYINFWEFLASNHLKAEPTKYNGDDAYMVTKCDPMTCTNMNVYNCHTNESQIPIPVGILEIRKGSINDIASSCHTMEEFKDKLNQSPYIFGNSWYVRENNNIGGEVCGKIYILNMSYNTCKDVTTESIKDLVVNKDLILLECNGYFMVGSKDKLINKALQACNENKIVCRKLEDYDDVFWADTMNYMYKMIQQ